LNFAGQYARAIACSAQLLKIPAVILAESGICPNEMRELQEMGSIVDLPSDKPSGPLSAAFNLQAFYVDPLDDPYTLAGLGTVALEILKQIQDYQNLQAIFCSVRAAGLLEAIGLSVKHFSPNVKVIGVDALPSTELSKLYGASTDPADTNFDAQITSPLKGSQDHLPVVSQDHLDRTLTTEISRVNPHVVDDIIMVKACEVQSAIRDVFQETRAIVDLNGALAVAGMTRYASVTGSLDAEQRVKSLVAVLSSADVVFEDIKAFI
jgi:threonine dehydratase